MQVFICLLCSHYESASTNEEVVAWEDEVNNMAHKLKAVINTLEDLEPAKKKAEESDYSYEIIKILQQQEDIGDSVVSGDLILIRG